MDTAPVFISYAGKDQQTATNLCIALESRGFRCWIANRDVPAGDHFADVIPCAIDAAKVMVLLFTRHANQSDEMKKELRLAGQRKLPVIPLKLEKVDPEGAFAYDLSIRQYIDNEAVGGWEALIGQLDSRISQILAEATASSIRPAVTNPSPRPVIVQPLPSRFVPPGSIIRDGPGPEMVLIPAGSFIMGISPEETEREDASSSVDDWARPQHKVTLARPFYMCKYPVTRGAFMAFARSADFLEDGWQAPRFKQTDQHPVVNVSHKDAVAYAAWLSRETGKDYRLPSEAEWEYAARAGTTTARFWGEGRAEACRYANVADETRRRGNKAQPSARQYFGCDDGSENTSPVGSFQPNGFGLYDMLGNVGEWTADWWNESYHGAPEDGSVWTAGDSGRGIVRGGSFAGFPETVRAGCRSSLGRGDRYDIVGFRLARTH